MRLTFRFLDPLLRIRAQRFVRDLPIGALPARVLELGSGTGHLAALLCNTPGTKFISSDLRNLGFHPPLLVCDAARIPLSAGSVDLIIVCGALQYVDTPEDVLREAFRVLVPGGRLLIAQSVANGRSARTIRWCTEFLQGPFADLVLNLTTAPGKRSTLALHRIFTSQELLTTTKKAGFSIKSTLIRRFPPLWEKELVIDALR